MEYLYLLIIFIAFELFEVNWQKSDSLYGLLDNNFLVFKKNVFLYFILHPSFFYTIFLSFYLNNFGFFMSSILILKFFDISIKLSLLKGLSKNKEMEDIVPYNIKMFPIIRYFNVITYPLFFLLATTL